MEVSVALVKKRYRFFNSKVFDGELPENITFKIRPLKGAYGHVISQWRGNEYAGIKEFNISSLYEFSEEIFDGIILHEMCHVYNAAIDQFKQAGHGSLFNKIRRHAASKSGIDVPISEEIGEIRIIQDKIKPYLIIVGNGPKTFFMPFNRTSFLKNSEILLNEFWNFNTTIRSRQSGGNNFTDITIYQSQNEKLYREIPIARKLNRRYPVSPNQEIFDQAMDDPSTSVFKRYNESFFVE